MDPVTLATGLTILGLVLIIIEATCPGGYLIIPGIDLLVLGVYGVLFPDLLYTWVSLLVAILLSIPVVAATLVMYKRLGGPAPPSTTVTGSLVGRSGTVSVETNPDNLKGKVKIGSDVWSADSDDVIPVGAEVVVESSEGVHVHVKRL